MVCLADGSRVYLKCEGMRVDLNAEMRDAGRRPAGPGQRAADRRARRRPSQPNGDMAGPRTGPWRPPVRSLDWQSVLPILR